MVNQDFGSYAISGIYRFPGSKSARNILAADIPAGIRTHLSGFGTKCPKWDKVYNLEGGRAAIVNRAIGRAILFAGIGRGMVFRANRTPNSLRRNRPWNTAPKGTT